MALKEIVAGITVAVIGAVGVGYASLADQDGTTRDESGAVVVGGELGAFRIRVGDCMIDNRSGDLVESVEGIPCGQPHREEAYHAFTLPEGDGTYPGDDVVDDLADTGCYDAFEPFVGLAYDQSQYVFVSLQPHLGSWDDLDDREVLCLISNSDGSPKTGSARGTSR